MNKRQFNVVDALFLNGIEPKKQPIINIRVF